MSPFRLAVVALFALPLVALGPTARRDRSEPLFRPVAKLPEGAVDLAWAVTVAPSRGAHNAIVLSPDGKRIAAGLFEVAVYDTDTGQPIRLLTPNGGNTIHRSHGPRDGRHLLVIQATTTGSASGTPRTASNCGTSR